MRKLYTLVTGLLISLVTMKTTGQPNAGFQTLISDPGNNTTNSAENYLSDEKNSDNNFLFSEIVSGSSETEITCTADFEINPTPNSPLSRKFSAIAWNSEQKRPVYI